MPRSGRDSIAGLAWLPRLLDKARRCETSDGRLVDGYCYGDNDFIDKQLITFLRTNDTTVSHLVREHPADADVATILVERSGRSAAEIAAFDKTFRRKNLDFVFVEADEGRLAPGFKATAIRFFYNNVVMRIFYPQFERDERKRTATHLAR
ncbi:MAG: DUF5069 domain-containing protein [Candidatus Eremiobacteraeota bacterium]|nr:DUF5069 domain-containing protein [Candidatus Eremiobacteraeota bacterium]